MDAALNGSWTVRRDVLLEAVRVLDLVQSQSGIPSSDFFLVTQAKKPGQIWMTTAAGAIANVKLEGTGEWPFRRPFYLDRRLFSPFVSSFREIKNKAPFEFGIVGKQLRMQCGRPFMDFSVQPSVMGYGDVPKLGVTPYKLVISDELLVLLKCAAGYAASEAESPHLACLYLVPQPKYLEIMSTNQKILFRAKHNGSHTIKNVIAFPLPMLGVLQAEGLKKLVWSNPFILAEFSNGVVWQTISHKASRNFPDEELRDRLARGRKLERSAMRANAARFSRVVERMSLYLQYVRKEDWVLNISGRKGSEQVVLVSRLPQAVITEYLKLLEPLRSDIAFDWPLDQLGGVFKFAGASDDVVEVKLEPEVGMSYVKFGPIEMALSTKRV